MKSTLSALDIHDENFNKVPAPPSWRWQHHGSTDCADFYEFKIVCYILAVNDRLRAGDFDFHFFVSSKPIYDHPYPLTFEKVREGGVICMTHNLPRAAYYRQFHADSRDPEALEGFADMLREAWRDRRAVTIGGLIVDARTCERIDEPQVRLAHEIGRFRGFDSRNTCPFVKVQDVRIWPAERKPANPFAGLLNFMTGRTA